MGIFLRTKYPGLNQLDFVITPDFDIIAAYSAKFGGEVQGNVLKIPPVIGEGILKRFNIAPDFKLVIHRYRVKDELVLNRISSNIPFDLVTLIFNCNEVPVSISTGDKHVHVTKNTGFAVQIASAALNSVTRFPANEDVFFTVVGLSVARLKGLLNTDVSNRTLQYILSSPPGFLFYESMGLEVQKVIKELADADSQNELSILYHTFKVQELIYLLFERLSKRTPINHSPIYNDDIDKLFLIRSAVLSDLSKPPRLKELSKMVGISETKMKELFKQVFGNSIYNFYQQARMQEAAEQLRKGDASVSEVGYGLGFTNLSHFSRLFERFHGVNPKKYSSV